MASEAAAAAAKAKKLNLEKATNFMRQYRDPHSRELKKLSANQFMEVWSHYDKDGECIQASVHCFLIYTTYVLTGGKQRQTTPKNLPKMQCAKAKPVT